MQKVFERPNATIYASIIEDEILNLFILDKTSFINRNFISKTFSNFTVMRDKFVEFLKNFAKSMEDGKTYTDRFNIKVDAFGTIDFIELVTEDGNAITMFHITESDGEPLERVNTEFHMLKMSLYTLIANLENLVENTTEAQLNNLS